MIRTLLVAVLAVPVMALAQAWPLKPIRLVVPYPPGGYTILLGTGATHGLTLLLSKTIPYDPVKHFTAITAAVEVPIILVVHPSIPDTTAKDLIEWGRKNPGKLAYGSSGTGSPHHLSGELLKQVAGIDMVHVPYKGAAPAVQDLIGNQIPAVFTTLSSALPHIRAGKLRAVGFVEARRQRSVPEIPTIGESVPGYVMPVVGTSSDEFARMVKDDIETFGRIVTAAGIKPE